MTALALLLALSADVRVQEEGGRFVFTNSEAGGEGVEVAAYHAEPSTPPAGVDATYARSGFVHPLKTPTGRVVTDDHAPDYAHQNGLFNTWTKTTFRGRRVDFWNRHKGEGTYRHAEVLDVRERGPVAVLKVRLEHLTLDPEVVVLSEDRTYEVSVQDGATVVDVHSIQRAVDDPLTCEDYHYGGFAVRGARGWNEPATMRTSEGLGRVDGNHSRPAWVAMTGPTENGPATIAVVAQATNFRSPQPARLHPEQPYFCFAACVAGEFTIERGRPLESRYRVLAFDGPVDSDRINAFSPPGEQGTSVP